MGTPKIDGIRCLIIDGEDGNPKAVSRKFKPIPNHHIREFLEKNCPIGFDGELVLKGGTFQQTASAVMSRDGTPNFEYRVFDWVNNPHQGYERRLKDLETEWVNFNPYRVTPVLPTLLEDLPTLLEYETACLTDGYEGVMVRTPNSPYKCGRSTLRQGYLLKIKRFQDSEAIIIGAEEKMHNDNPQERDELGLSKRSSHKANQVPMDTLGALHVQDVKTKVKFRIGTGFDDQTRDLLWAKKDSLCGKLVKYKFQPSGVLEKPRFPVFLGMRSSL